MFDDDFIMGTMCGVFIMTLMVTVLIALTPPAGDVKVVGGATYTYVHDKVIAEMKAVWKHAADRAWSDYEREKQ